MNLSFEPDERGERITTDQQRTLAQINGNEQNEENQGNETNEADTSATGQNDVSDEAGASSATGQNDMSDEAGASGATGQDNDEAETSFMKRTENVNEAEASFNNAHPTTKSQHITQPNGNPETLTSQGFTAQGARPKTRKNRLIAPPRRTRNPRDSLPAEPAPPVPENIYEGDTQPNFTRSHLTSIELPTRKREEKPSGLYFLRQSLKNSSFSPNRKEKEELKKDEMVLTTFKPKKSSKKNKK